MREKLIELLSGFSIDTAEAVEFVADYLIANGVTIPVRCKDCKHYKPQKKSDQWHGTTPYCCRCTTVKVSPDDFCSYGERKDNG